MLDSTVEFISQAASSSLFVFCFCNLIIAAIFVGSKSKSILDRSWVPASMPIRENNADETPVKAESPTNCREKSPAAEPEKMSTQCNMQQIEDEDYDHEEDEDQEDGDNDELRMRVEDFIAKVNREWKAENLRARAAS